MAFDFENMYCGALRRGDIFLCEMKKRKEEQAVVVLQDSVVNDGLPTVVCAPVAPYRHGQEVFVNEVLLPKKETGLGTDGLVLLHKIITVDRQQMVTKKGEVNQERLREIYHALDINLGRFRDHHDR